MDKRNVLFQQENVSQKVLMELPGNVLDPPKFVQFKGILYEYSGSGAGGNSGYWTNFYRVVPDFFIKEE